MAGPEVDRGPSDPNPEFPLTVALGSTGGPQRRTEIITLGSGREERNQRWQMSRRYYDAGTGVKHRDDLHKVVEFFEERRGRLRSFRFRDPLDHKSCPPSHEPSSTDQLIGIGDGDCTAFPLIKLYGTGNSGYERPILYPVAGTILVNVGGQERTEDLDFTVEDGEVQFRVHAVPPRDVAIRAGFVFDVPVRFDTDRLDISLSRFLAGEIPSVPLVEVLP